MQTLFAAAGRGMLISAVGLFVGCGGVDDAPDVAPVTGTVTLDGQPLEGATVTFNPVGKGGRPSYGMTDAEGYYELVYSRQADGAMLGEHQITISTFVPAEPETEPVPEKVPAKYNENTELTKTVEAGDNVIDFKLDSEGEIIEPSLER